MIDYNTWNIVQVNYNIPQIIEPVWKLSLAIGIGLIIGKERKRHARAGGSRTMALISLCSSFLAILSTEIHKVYPFDFVRLMAYLLPAIGFIGMGVISKTKNNVDGLTTSATLLILLPIGFAIGLGYYIYGSITAFFTWLILESKYSLRRKRGKKRNRKANS